MTSRGAPSHESHDGFPYPQPFSRSGEKGDSCVADATFTVSLKKGERKMLTQVFHLHALSALHVGAGQALGAVDLPIARAKATNLPLVPGSALKGVLRDEFAGNANQATLFGPEKIAEGSTAHAGALTLGDAQLLLLPVRSLAGVSAFVTCPFVLARYAEDLQREESTAGNGSAAAAVPAVPAVPEVGEGTALVSAESCLKATEQMMVLEDLDLAAKEGADAWAQAIAERVHAGKAQWQAMFRERFAILADDDFSFLADTATEVRSRIRIDDSRGVVQDGALWYEENLPAETLLWGNIAAGPARDTSQLTRQQVLAAFCTALGREATIQIGGKATIGRGLVRFVLGKQP
jgi:CRISPR-associated RAMP protein, Cmr4 family